MAEQTLTVEIVYSKNEIACLRLEAVRWSGGVKVSHVHKNVDEIIVCLGIEGFAVLILRQYDDLKGICLFA